MYTPGTLATGGRAEDLAMPNRRVVSRAAKSAAVFVLGVLGVFTVACGGSDPAPAPAATAPAAPVDPARAAIEKRIARARALE